MKSLVYSPEVARLEALYQYQILDTKPEPAFDDLVFLAAQICDTPIAVINLVDADRQWFKAKVGLDFEQVPRYLGFCPICIAQCDVLIIPDTLADAKFANSEIVTGEPYVRFYAGVPLLAPGGQAIGTLCVVDRIPHEITPKQIESLQALSRLVIRQLEIRKNPQLAYLVDGIKEKQAALRDRQQAEAELRWKEALLRSMTSVSPLAFYVVDNRTDNILYFNQQFCEIWGIEHLEAQMAAGKLQNQDIIPDCAKLILDIPAFAASCQPLQNEEYRAVVEDEIKFNDGRTIRRFSTQVRDRNDQYFGRLYIFEDITSRKQVEQQIREQAALLDISTDAIVLRDLSNNILLWNKSAEQLYGWQAEEAIGKNACQLFNNEPLLQYQEICQTVLGKGSWQGELQKTSKSGREIIVESCWMLVLDEHSQPKSILIVDTDITHKKQLEQQFFRAQRMESIGTLASGIAHDLNNVLSPILMSVHFLKNKLPDRQSSQMLSIVENNVKRGANLVKQVLSFARGIEGDRQVIQLRNILLEVNEIIQETFPKSITLSTEIAEKLSPIYSDSTQIHQVLINLCLNARDAMPSGGNITISAANIYIDENYARMNLDAQVGYYIVLKVADTGCGIPSEVLDRIFEPFFTTKEFGKGTGLGLSTVMGIIKGHNGFITVSSCIDQGTEFQVYLPAVNTATTQILEDSKIEHGRGEWVLIVDDEAAIREVTATSLESHNYQIIAARDGIEAIALYAQNTDKIKAAIIDIMMPNMDGDTTIRTLQKMNPKLSIIAVSGISTGEKSPINQTVPNVAFLLKPYTVQELLKTLHLVLS
ncbi:multi-sensor hybrid histidine kinase [Tolypothrix tenuis PCC 7101]|uniref:histidine kinase n=1 Tax=Tolypothrix tenuis PCC 7101 TaxID=231146 RepID=A0A1Z4N3Y1_9CYAN|nr:PAS domain S-box protein [Aulosira sp. FACHB-113]BAZ00453.1 multi-sensor hybrid histidine kinase [Tolypothrix tenuis PCC 7101]BAZ75625.1 multi-sensor hybrid histidine kinase [Aulosira laxa NIES-50]